MHNLKFCNKLISLLDLTFKQNHLWFDIISTRSIITLSSIFQKLGVVSGFFIFKKSKRTLLRVFLKYINLELPLILPINFYFKPSHKLSISLSTLIKLNQTLGCTSIILSTSKGLLLHNDCIRFGVGGILFLIVYS